MDLSEIYSRGKDILQAQKIGFTLDGVETGWVRENNRKIFNGFAFRQKAIDAPSAAATDVEILGIKLQTPIIMSAMTMPIPAVHEEGLSMVAEGLKKAGSLLWTGTPIPRNLKRLTELGVPTAQNSKPYEDRKKLLDELAMIEDSGVDWIGLEIDSGQGTKIGDTPVFSGCRPFTMADLNQIRKRISKPLIFKGILSAHDAGRSVEAGADAIMVSNHGAHTLDYLPHPMQVMEEITSVVAGKIPIFIDGGFRRGSDVLKGLAFGAELVGLGRPILYGLAAGGMDGVHDVIRNITAELRRIMVMVGAGAIDQISRHCIIRV